MLRHSMVRLSALALAVVALLSCKQRQGVSGLRDDDTTSKNNLKACAYRMYDPKNTGIEVNCNLVDEITVETTNKPAYDSKIELIQKAEKTIDAAYFIYTFDQSSSYFNRLLLEKAAAGVRVRLLVDAVMAMPNMDDLNAFVKESMRRNSSNPIQVRLFRPLPKSVYKDLNSWGFTDNAALGEALAGFEIDKFKALASTNDKLTKLWNAVVPGAALPKSQMDLLLKVALKKRAMNASDWSQVINQFLDGMTFDAAGWVQVFKRLHHKLLVVDGTWVQGGGRNVENPYHMEIDMLRKAQAQLGGTEESSFKAKHPAFMDTDFYTKSEPIAALAEASFEEYWNMTGTKEQPSMPWVLPLTGDAAPSDAGPVDPAEPKPATAPSKIEDSAKAYEQLADGYQLPDDTVFDGRFVTHNAPVAYIENKMTPSDPSTTSGLLFGEVASQYNTAWARLLASSSADEPVILQNAYLMFTPMIMEQLAGAARRGQKIIIITNSQDSSPQGFVAHLAKPQFKYLKKVALDPNNVKIYEYATTDLSLHAKVAAVGDYLIVGATNADPRSEFLDTQNGVIIGPGVDTPIGQQYRDWVTKLLAKQYQGKPALRELTSDAINNWVPDMDKDGNCPTDDPQRRTLCYIGRLTELSAEPSKSEAGTVAAKGIRAMLTFVFLNL